MTDLIDIVYDETADGIDANITFDWEPDLKRADATDPNIGLEDGEVCTFFLRGNCKRGNNCTFRHVKSEKTVVCKHWLRSLCKKGENCEFLHQYDLSKMPECYFFSKFGECSNPDCVYLHINPDEKVAECPFYARGFCKQGPKCRLKHVRKIACESYLQGFCMDGPNCKFDPPKDDGIFFTPLTRPRGTFSQSIQTFES